MREPVNWQDHIVGTPNTYKMNDNGDGTVTLEKITGTIYQQGTPMNATNFNHMDHDISDAHVASVILLQGIIQSNYSNEEEIGEVTLTNTLQFPFNDSAKSISMKINRNNLTYQVTCEVLDSDGNVGDFVVTDKQLNGFKLGFDGSAASVTVRYKIKGGIF